MNGKNGTLRVTVYFFGEERIKKFMEMYENSGEESVSAFVRKTMMKFAESGITDAINGAKNGDLSIMKKTLRYLIKIFIEQGVKADLPEDVISFIVKFAREEGIV